MSPGNVFREKGGDGRRSGRNLSTSFELRGKKGRWEGGNVGAEGWKRIGQEEKGAVQKRRNEIRIPSALREMGRGFKWKQS